MVENNSTQFRCNICNKNYKDKSGLWYHNNKNHKTVCKSNVSQLSANFSQMSTNVSQMSVNVSQNKKTINEDKIDGYCCEYCGTTYLHRQSKYKHQIKCKNKSVDKDEEKKIEQKEIINLLIEQIKEQKEKLEEQEQQNKEIKKTLMELLNKNCKVHPKTLQKINKQLNLNGDHNTINETINNGTVNNTYNIIALGHENLTNVFSRKEKMAILKYRYCSLPHMVEYTHFNDKYPQFKNILITNTQNTLAYKFDNKKKQFITVDKNDLLEDIIDERMCDLSSFYDELENDLDEKTKEIIEIVKEKIDSDPAYKELKKKDIKLIIYNNRKKVDKDLTNEIELEV
jgi:hypothetical protein